MSTPIAGESIWFHKWETDHHVQYVAIVRTAESADHGEVNLSWFDEDGIESQDNNVKNIEQLADLDNNDYWRRRYSNQDISWLTGLLETTRVEKGGMVLFRSWDSEDHWKGGFYAVVVSTLGSPSDPHPTINIRYINTSGVSTLVSNLDPIEGYSSEDDAEGNDLWSNIPIIIEGM